MAPIAAGSVRDALAAALGALEAAGVQSPRFDAEVLLAEASGWDRARLAADPDAGIAADAGRRFAEMVRRRLRREPVAYILGRRGFRKIELAVDRRVLIPRPETELLVEIALGRCPATVLDVGTGSGAVALAIAEELPGCEVSASDTSPAALALARTNAERLGLSGRVGFFEGSLPVGQTFDLILANLPYVAESEWAGLEPEVSEWEPPEALLAGPDGLSAIRALLAQLERNRSQPEGESAAAGAVALEVGEGQAAAVGQLLRSAGFAQIEIRLDLAGVERVILGEP
jgi:release factor glutamine methyltransferase